MAAYHRSISSCIQTWCVFNITTIMKNMVVVMLIDIIGILLILGCIETNPGPDGEEEPADVETKLQRLTDTLTEKLDSIDQQMSSLTDQVSSMQGQLAEVHAQVVVVVPVEQTELEDDGDGGGGDDDETIDPPALETEQQEEEESGEDDLRKMGKGTDMDGCGRFMKYSMFVANFIIFLGGSAVLGIGVWTLADKAFINELLGTNLFMGAVYVMIATGALVGMLAFFGCLGAAKEVKCMLLLYFVLVLIIFVVMLVGGVLGYVFRETVHNSMEQEMQASLRLYGEKRAITNAWDSTQETLKCCGVVNYLDWQDKLPESCCKFDEEGQRTQCRYNSENIYENGCLIATEEFVREHASILAGAGIGVACLMLLGMIFSFALFKSIE